jgi:hypothetical protein
MGMPPGVNPTAVNKYIKYNKIYIYILPLDDGLLMHPKHAEV